MHIMTFNNIDKSETLAMREKRIRTFWEQNNTFKRSVEERPIDNEYVFLDGPPFATGTPHYGHLLQGTLKDLIPRYKTMRGYRVARRFGWDCHGVPVEFQVEKEHKIGGKEGIEKMGIAAFHKLCREQIDGCETAWKPIVDMMGRWVDFDDDYKTMYPWYMESVWWVFKTLYDKQLIYEGEKVIFYSPKLASPLSNFEASEGYKDRDDTTITVLFKLTDGAYKDDYIAVWTTTPWTLPANMALAMSATLDYVRILKDNKYIWIAKNALSRYGFTDDDIQNTQSGSVFKGMHYEPLYDYKAAYKVLLAPFVEADTGTGTVHIAPCYGQDDYTISKENGILDDGYIDMIDDNGYFTDAFPLANNAYFTADSVIEGSKENNANDIIVDDLYKKGLIIKKETIRHSYPHCYRTDCALMYRAIKTWFVDVQKIKERMIDTAKEIHWIPEHVQNGRFGNGLKTAPDWAISRNRYWGTPLPVWKCDCCNHTDVIGSRKELYNYTDITLTDLHREHVDGLEWACTKCDNGRMKRISEVLDCWFESGSMPYASLGYPYKTDIYKPADFIAEAIEQCRTWFYSLHVLGTALFDKPVFKHAIASGIVLTDTGQKMSKSKKNYEDPAIVMQKYGADSFRWLIMTSPVVRGEDMKFSEKGLLEVIKSVINPLQNAYTFLSTYANADKWAPTDTCFSDDYMPSSTNMLDTYMLSETHKLIQHITTKLDNYEIDSAYNVLPAYLETLNNWYIRRSRKRFWASYNESNKADKDSSYHTLHYILYTLTKLIAPIMPYIAEDLYSKLGGKDSVHMQYFPIHSDIYNDYERDEQIEMTREIIALTHSIRAKVNIKLRQPLSKIQYYSPYKTAIDSATIREEANIEAVETLIDMPINVKKVLILDPKKAGPLYGKKVQSMIQSGKNGMFTEHNGSIILEDEVLPDGVYTINYTAPELINAEGSSRLLVLLDTHIDTHLLHKGYFRELLRLIQDIRKAQNLDITDRISISYSTTDDALKTVIDTYKTDIMNDTLADNIIINTNIDMSKQYDIDDKTIYIEVKKI